MPKSNIKAWRHSQFWKHYNPREQPKKKMEPVEEEVIPEAEAGGVEDEPKDSSSRFDLFFCVGGYWSKDDEYFGGESHPVGSVSSHGFNRSSITKIVVDDLGYEDTMNMVSWFPPGSVKKKVDILDEDLLGIAVQYGISVGALTLFIARSDDPFVGRHKDMRGYVLGEAEEDEGEDASDFETEVASEAGGLDLEGYNSDSISAEHVQDSTISTSDSEYENRSSSMTKSVFRLGQEFANIAELKRCIIKYAVKKKRDIKFEKSEQKRVVAICSDKACPWRISGSINSSSPRVVIRSYNEEHNCTWQGQISLLTNTRIAELFLEDFRINPHISASQLQMMLLKRNINVTDTKCERSRLHCLQTFDDESSETFGRFYDYVEELKRSNPGSTVELDVRQGMFHRFFVCFKALKDGWRSSCRKIIHIDGTFLKWRMNGMLLIACGRDPNEQMFPIAWGIVDIENKDNWMWFFEHLQEDLGLEEGNGLTLSSDQQKGLILAVKAVLPYAEHMLCARHVYSNWKKRHGGAILEDLFWGAADAYYKEAFDRKLEEIKKYSLAAFEDLHINVGCPWSRAFFTENSTCEAVENNLGESFNAAIRIARTKPPIQMLEEIRQKVMVSNEKKRTEAERVKGDYVPKALAALDEQIERTKNCRPLSCGLGNYEVAVFKESFVVQLRGDVSCTCRMYKVSGIPCCHIVSALRREKSMDPDPKKLLSPYFKLDKLKSCYGTPMNPVNGMNLWKVTTNLKVKPPPFKTPLGRPKGKARTREKGEGRAPAKNLPRRGLKIHCGNCGEEGHNRAYCRNGPVPKPPKNPRGRPRVRPEARPSAGQFIQPDAAMPATRKRKRFAYANLVKSALVDGESSRQSGQQSSQQSGQQSSQQQYEDLPSISAALPKRGRGRPRKDKGLAFLLGVSSSQP